MFEELQSLIGIERGVDEVSAALSRQVAALGAPVVGALHLTCADETEWEGIDAFQKQFVDERLPELKFARRAAFHISNLAARYEPGAIAVAEHHYATAETHDAFKVLLLKLNSHVGVVGSGSQSRFGSLRRYGTDSAACGGLHALFEHEDERKDKHADKPFLSELRALFALDGLERVALLQDPGQVTPLYRGLLVAVVNAELQARMAAADACEHQPHSPTLYLIASCVTMNRPGQDTELLCGVHSVDWRGNEAVTQSAGLGDDPSKMRVTYELGRLRVIRA